MLKEQNDGGGVVWWKKVTRILKEIHKNVAKVLRGESVAAKRTPVTCACYCDVYVWYSSSQNKGCDFRLYLLLNTQFNGGRLSVTILESLVFSFLIRGPKSKWVWWNSKFWW